MDVEFMLEIGSLGLALYGSYLWYFLWVQISKPQDSSLILSSIGNSLALKKRGIVCAKDSGSVFTKSVCHSILCF